MNCYKEIKVGFSDFYPEFNIESNIITNCLSAHYKLILSTSPDFLFYSCFGRNFFKYNKCIKIFYTKENVRPDFNECDYAISLDRIDFNGRNFRQSMLLAKPGLENIDYTKRKFCNFIYSNSNSGHLAALRQNFCKQLQKYKTVDCPGKVLNNMKDTIIPRDGDWVKGKLQFLKNYKFTIAFENSSSPGYVTEKIQHAFLTNSIPIYYGAPDVTLDYNPKAFVNCHDFKNFDEVIEYIIYLDNDDDAYMEMLLQPPMASSYDDKNENLEDFLINIIENGTKQANDPRRRYSPAYYFSSSINTIKNELIKPFVKDVDVDTAINNIVYNFNDLPAIQSIRKQIADNSVSPAFLSDYFAFGSASDEQARQRFAVFNSAKARFQIKDKAPQFSVDTELENIYRSLFRMLHPHSLVGTPKIRIGGDRDVGYVMLDPTNGGIAYSFGVSCHSPWDIEMAKRGFTVFQFDGNIENAPEFHPNMHFIRKNITSKEPPADNEINLPGIISMLGHVSENNIVLQMDVEWAEWDFFENATPSMLAKFSQIIVEFHGLPSKDKLPAYAKIFKKILKTHIPVHFHYNNNGHVLCFQDFMVSSLWEISFARRDMGMFKSADESYPTDLDHPNLSNIPELHIGKFDVISSKFPPCPRHVPPDLHDGFTLGGRIPVLEQFYDNRASQPLHITNARYEQTLAAIGDGSFKYYDKTLDWLREAFSAFQMRGKTVLVHDLAGCNCDALALFYGAAQVIAVDYNKPQCDHPRVIAMSVQELRDSGMRADLAISISSFEHDGLGRYGDPLSPEGDLRAMREAKNSLKPDGLLFLAVPVGPDCLVFNAHRIYGPLRLPMLLSGWTPITNFGMAPNIYQKPLGVYGSQPVLVLANSRSATNIPAGVSDAVGAQIKSLATHGAFDTDYYMTQYPDILIFKGDPVSHYVIHGAREGRNPTAWFNTLEYSHRHPELAQKGINPFLHYLCRGFQQNVAVNFK